MPTTVKDLLAAARAAVPAITPQETAALAASGKAVVVDVRDGTEVQANGKVKGARHVSRGLLEFKADPDSPLYDPAFQKDKTIILYCASGGRSALAGKTLKDMGYTDVRNLGGFQDWVTGGGAVEK
ncbi:MAG TPA: rhodanese-like domain-containing protein [Candidatus Acidoferrum sp.]|nr:rhodanese-like domain-containing protein [Candidatus Acidoferrum sp.]